MAIIQYPSAAVPDSANVSLESNTGSHESDLNRAVQTFEMSGARWRLILSYANRGGTTPRLLKTFLASLRGRANRFKYTPPDIDQMGSMAGTGVVVGGSQTGNELETSGWDNNQSELFLPGDYFEVNGELKLITDTISSDGTGNATLVFEPPLRKSPPALDPIIVDEPKALFMLEDDKQSSWQLSAPIIYSYSISAVEDVTP